MVRVSDNLLLEFKTEKLIKLIFFKYLYSYKLMSNKNINCTNSSWLTYKINYIFIECQNYKSNKNIAEKQRN